MSTILIRDPLSSEEITCLEREFPEFGYRLDVPDAPLKEEEWAEVEVLYGSSLSAEELELSHRLRWIHAPITSLHDLCLSEIEATTNILITNTKNPNTHQPAEFAMGALLAFSKNLFHWKQTQGDPRGQWDDSVRGTTWEVRERTHLQIGLGAIGSGVASSCEQLGMRVWGLHDPPSFHPACRTVYPPHDLHSLLPAADTVCVSMRRGRSAEPILAKAQFELMKQDAILIVTGSPGLIDQKALTKVAEKGKFKGIALDVPLQIDEKQKPQLWDLPQVLITPEIAELPRETERIGYRLFLHNLRRYIHNDFPAMKNAVLSSESLV